MSLSRVFSINPITDSFVEQLTISHLFNRTIRQQIGALGIRKVCDPLRLFRLIFANPEEFNKIFISTDTHVGGPGVMEYIFRGDICEFKDSHPSIIIYAQYDDIPRIHDYYEKYESMGHNETGRFHTIYRMRSGNGVAPVGRAKTAKLSRVPTFARDGIRISFSSSPLDELWPIGTTNNIWLGVPRIMMGIIDLFIFVTFYMEDIKQEYVCELIPDRHLREPRDPEDAQLVADALLIYSIAIFPTGNVDEDTYITQGAPQIDPY